MAGLVPARLDRLLLVAGATLAVAVLALDCAWQRFFIPRLMGLEGRYYSNAGREGEAALTAIDTDIATGTLERRRRQIGAEAFSVAWTGQVETPAPGEYTFFTWSEGPLGLVLDGTPVVETRSGGEATGTASLSAGRHEVLLLYSQGGGEARLSLAWARNRQPREPLSGEHLLPPRPNGPALGVYGAVRAVLRGLLGPSVLIAIAAALVAVAPASRRALRERGGVAAVGGLAALLVTGAFVLDDFGVSLDETMQRRIGLANYLYLSQGASLLLDRDFPERLYGPAFELPLVVVEKQLGLSDSRAIYLVRHAATFLLFCLAVGFFHRLCLRQFRSWPTAIFACGCLVLSPRIFADSFYNSKDLPFLSVFVVSVYTLVRFLDEGTVGRAFWHALASAVLADIRIVGLVVPAITVLLAAGDLLFVRRPDRPVARRAATLAAYAGLLACLTVAFFPYLWTSPFRHLAEVFAQMSRFPFHRTSLYLGQALPPRAIPWHYAPVWIGVTTPLAYLGLFGVGLLVVAASCATGPARLFGHRETRNRLLWVLWLFVPLATVVATKATLYDGWRHLFFVYPALVLIAVEGASRIASGLRRALPVRLVTHGGAIVAGLCLFVFAEPALFMVRHHPYGNVFFNRLAGDGMRTVRNRFEVDYWGLSYRRGLEYVLRHDGRGTIKVLLQPGLGEASAAILPARERLRLAFVRRRREAEYLLGNYRWQSGEYPFRHEVYSVRVGDASVLSVYDLRYERW
ncbi:MAG TPA: PA14 domain-containing protein [Vicinamibacteria bacterium]|nr:PA14 domain-containing protein [Vicinamibacteria bacterium]